MCIPPGPHRYLRDVCDATRSESGDVGAHGGIRLRGIGGDGRDLQGLGTRCAHGGARGEGRLGDPERRGGIPATSAIAASANLADEIQPGRRHGTRRGRGSGCLERHVG
eukprot:6059381-Prymnesium_polylepis.1